jgi:redox-sensitive bicupin YhaK (pirin superfamily)
MAFEVRRDADIAGGSGGWYAARWHFSFGPYFDPERSGLGPLRVLNDDLLVPGGVWPMHPHRDVESLTYVVEGHFRHADSLGNGGELGPGGVQAMTFGPRGAEHSEMNGDPDRTLRFLQFWILADRPDLTNGVQQRQYTVEDRTDRWLTVMSPVGEDGLDLQQDARVRVARLSGGASLDVEASPGRGAYLYVIEGGLEVSGTTGALSLATGDALVLEGPEAVTLAGALPASELWLADVPLAFTPHGVWSGMAHRH